MSISPLRGTKYPIPTHSDSNEFDAFIRNNDTKKIVAVQGLGFVGTVMSLVVANSEESEYAVVGVDQATSASYWKIAEINGGILPIISSDPLVSQYFEESKVRNNFFATANSDAFACADVIIVDINLDVNKIKDRENNLAAFDVPMEDFTAAMRTIGKVCKPNVLVLVETTVPPGACRKIVYPVIEEELVSRGLPTDSFRLGHSYERVMPGPNYINSIKNFYRVYSGIDDESADAVRAFLETIISTNEYPLTRLKTTESTEMAKVLENSYRAMNISFAIEWSRFAELSGVDLYEVVDAIRLRPTHANLMYPGIGVGGYCLTKDPLLASWASKEFFGLPDGLEVSVQAVERNDKMPKYCFDFVNKILNQYKSKKLSIGLLGVAYGPGIGDTRFSPVEDFYKLLSLEFDQISLHDPYVSRWVEMSLDVETSLPHFFKEVFDVIIVTTAHRDYVMEDEIYDLINSSDKQPVIIDTVGLLDSKKLPASYIQDQNFYILGVGHQKE